MGKDLFLVVIYDSKHVRCADTAAKLYLPCTLSEFEDALQKARIEDERKCKKDLIQVLYPGILSDMLGRDIDLRELNVLAARLSILNEKERIGLEGMLQLEKANHSGSIPLSRLINLTFHTDKCLQVPGITSDESLGEYLYKSGEFSPELTTVLDSVGQETNLQKMLLMVFGQRHRLTKGGLFTDQNYMEPKGEIGEVYWKGRIPCFPLCNHPVVVEMGRGSFDDSGCNETTVMGLPARDDAFWQAMNKVGAASPEECAFRCIDCKIPALRDAVNDAIEEGGIGQANAFARVLSKKMDTWSAKTFAKYKAILSVSGYTSLQDAVELMQRVDEYHFRPEVATGPDYAKLALQERYPNLPEELLQTPQADQVGRRMLEEDNAAITEYGLIQRKDGGPLRVFQQEQEEFSVWGGMEMI